MRKKHREEAALKAENDRLKRQIEIWRDAPEECKAGPWCTSCMYFYHDAFNYVNGCALGACECFAPRGGTQ